MYYLAEAIFFDTLPCPREKLETEYAPAHVKYMHDAFESGIVVLAGPKGNAPGGFLLLKCDDPDALQAFLDNDPLVIHKIQYFKVTPWKIVEHPENF